MRNAGAAIGALAVIAIAGCGERRETTTGAGVTAAPAAVDVTETEFKITPAAVDVARAGPVEVRARNAGGTEHALAIATRGGIVKTATIAPGKSATLRATLKAGTYTWYCPIDGHRAKGMTGKLVVAGGGSGGSAAPGGSSSGGRGGY